MRADPGGMLRGGTRPALREDFSTAEGVVLSDGETGLRLVVKLLQHVMAGSLLDMELKGQAWQWALVTKWRAALSVTEWHRSIMDEGQKQRTRMRLQRLRARLRGGRLLQCSG